MRLSFFTRICIAIFALASSLPNPTHAIRFEDLCRTSRPLALAGSVQMDGIEAGATEVFSLEMPASGILAVEIAVPGFETAVPWIEFLPAECARLLDRSLGRQVLALTEAGTYRVRVGAVSPDQPLPGYKLSVHFLGFEPFDDATSWPDLLTKDGEEGDDTEEGDQEILPIVVNIPPGAGEEPANDLSVCAGRLFLHGMTPGELDSSAGTDHDYFTFELEHARRVRVFTTGTTDTLGTLYDEHGQRLVADDDGGDGHNFAIDAMLSSGRYFVRVEGALGSEGAYELRLSSSNQEIVPRPWWE